MPGCGFNWVERVGKDEDGRDFGEATVNEAFDSGLGFVKLLELLDSGVLIGYRIWVVGAGGRHSLELSLCYSEWVWDRRRRMLSHRL